MALSNVSRGFSWLRRFSHPIATKGDDVEVLYTPQDFFRTLKKEILNAKHTILISSLYVGTGHLERELINDIHSALTRNPTLQCTLLLDYFRNHRGKHNTMAMLLDSPLPRSHGNRFQVYLYHTPQLRGLTKQLVPDRFNELVGLQHTKLFICDENVILSGANLSNDYFTMRQDRYLVFRSSPRLASFFASFHRILCQHSFRVLADGSTAVPTALGIDPLASRSNALKYKQSLNRAVSRFIEMNRPQAYVEPALVDRGQTQSNARPTKNKYSSSEISSVKCGRGRDTNESDSGSCSQSGLQVRLEVVMEDEECDTVLFPLLQLGLYGISQDQLTTQELLQRVDPGERVFLASGYFNLPPLYLQAILSSKGEYCMLAASPQAVGFFTAKGIAKNIPYLYAKFADDFLDRVRQGRQQERIKYLEYERKGWTFHGKGLWYYTQGESLPSLTLVGSSNYGHRSLNKDLEAQIAVVTTNHKLRQALHKEQELLYSYGRPIPPGGRRDPPPAWVRIVSRALQKHA